MQLDHGEGSNMKQWMRKRSAFFFAGASLVLGFCLMFLLENPAYSKRQWYAGWIVWIVGIVLIFLPMFVLRSKGGVAKGEGYVQTTVLVDSSIYSVVRHPQYLGWLLMYPAMMLFNPHWLIVGLGLLGMACVYLFTRQEDEHLVEKFGKPYGRYMQTVPRMNLIAGIVQLVRGTQRK